MKERLYCIDSDGCAMDTMTIKHEKCFGPKMVQVFGLGKYEVPVLKRWNEINLYEETRGVNRFLGLHMMLREVDATWQKISGLEVFGAWCQKTKALSESALAEEIMRLEQEKDDKDLSCLKKALLWSKETNLAIDALTAEEKQPFSGVLETLRAMHEVADIAVVSSANKEAVMEEWERCGLLAYVDYVCAQNIGSKKACIAMLLEKGYDRAKVTMIGDARGDEEAAIANGVAYYAIRPEHEEECWRTLGTFLLP